MNMSAEPQNIGYFYAAGIHHPAQSQIPFYGNNSQMMDGQYRYTQELDQSGHIYNSQNYYIQPPPFSKNSLNQINMGSNHGLCQHEDNEGHLGRSRGDSINFLPITSENYDDNNFYPHNQDQIVSSNFQNDLNPYSSTHSNQNLQPICHNQQNYSIDDMNVSHSDMMYPYNNYGPNHPQYPMMQNAHHNNLNYLSSNYQIPASSQNYFMNDISNLPISQHNSQHYAYQNMSTSFHNLCFDGENIQKGMQEDKLSNFQSSPFKNALETPLPKNKKKGTKKVELLEKDNVKNEHDCSDVASSYLKSTEKVKRRYTESTECSSRKNETKEEAFSNDENSPSGKPLNVKRPLQTPKQKKSKTLSEATTNFELNSDINTPTLKENSYKKIKIEEKENQVKSSSSTEQSTTKIPSSEQQIQTLVKGGLLSLPQEKMIEQLKNIMKSLPQAYLPFMHKKQSDSQKFEYLKKNFHIPYQSDLNKIRSLLPSNFMDYFDVSADSVQQNSYIMNGILQNMPDESAKKIGTITKKERREKINKYKAKRDKRASCRKISYDVRKRVADSRLRVKGRFVTKEQALQMIGDTSSDPDKYTNQELRDLLYKKFGAENGERSKKLSLTADESLNLLSLNNDHNFLNESDYEDEYDNEMEDSQINSKK